MCFQKVDADAAVVGAEQALEVAGYDVHFDVDRGANLVTADRRHFGSMGNNIQVEPGPRYLVDGKADPVDADGPLLRDIAGIIIRNFDAKADRPGVAGEANDLAYAVDVACLLYTSDAADE